MSYGRVKIYTDKNNITSENVIDEISGVYALYNKNQVDIKRLWNYYRGDTDIQHKTKEMRESINHKINENLVRKQKQRALPQPSVFGYIQLFVE